MQTETSLLTKKNKILILFSYIGLILIFLLYMNYNIPCIFKKIFNIPCPSCGLTRAFKLILKLQITKSLSYNILTIPIIIILSTILISTIIDIIFNKQYLNKILNKIIKNYKIIILLLIISWIINIHRNI